MIEFFLPSPDWTLGQKRSLTNQTFFSTTVVYGSKRISLIISSHLIEYEWMFLCSASCSFPCIASAPTSVTQQVSRYGYSTLKNNFAVIQITWKVGRQMGPGQAPEQWLYFRRSLAGGEDSSDARKLKLYK